MLTMEMTKMDAQKQTIEETIDSAKTSNDLLQSIEDILGLVEAIGKKAVDLEEPEQVDEVVENLMSTFATMTKITSAQLEVIVRTYQKKRASSGDGENAEQQMTKMMSDMVKIDKPEDVLDRMNLISNLFSGVIAVTEEALTLNDRDEVATSVSDIFNSIHGLTMMSDHVAIKADEIGVNVNNMNFIEELLRQTFVLGRLMEALNREAEQDE